MARIGKIARLPKALRDEVCTRLENGQLSPQILPWLNAQPEVQALVATAYGGQEISPANLSDWRLGGFVDWQRGRGVAGRTRLLSERALAIAREAGGKISEGAAAILSGRILEILEELPDDCSAEALSSLVKSVSLLRQGDLTAARNEHERERLKRTTAQWQWDAMDRGLQLLNNERAREIAASDGDNRAKIEALGQLMFGEDWEGIQENAEGGMRKAELKPAVDEPAHA
jgi:hypothetical protein